MKDTPEYKEKARIKNRRLRLAAYGLTPEDYDRMFAEQNGLCAICGEPPREGYLAVDHDHETGEVRGLLHRHCNSSLGWYEKNRSRVERYLTR